MPDADDHAAFAAAIPPALRDSWLAQTGLLLSSYRRLFGRDLIERGRDGEEDAARLFAAPFAVLSHGTENDPVLNYANAFALILWEMTAEQLIVTPSRLTAEPMLQAARQQLLAETARNGFMTGYSGVRISATGRRFRIEDVTLWNLSDAGSLARGQAAAFARWSPVEPG